jgi:type VI secretion system protein ImpM
MTAGYYGKLPSRGDFLSRRLPHDFLEVWDRWIQEAFVSSRSQLGEEWLGCYLTSPAWRVVMGAGALADKAFAAVVIPSVDRVGRYYPFLIACQLRDSHNALALSGQEQLWFVGAEQLALEALDEAIAIDELDARILALGMPDAASLMTSDPPRPKTATFWRFPISSVDRVSDAFPGLTAALFSRVFPVFTLWWTEGSEHVKPSFLACPGLPPPASYSALLTGSWDTFGWAEP